MKNAKSKSSLFAILTLVLISLTYLSGCSKQEKEVVKENNEPKTEVSKQNPGEVKDQSGKSTSNDRSQENVKEKENSNEGHDQMHMEDEGNKKINHSVIKIPSAQCDICKKKISKALKKVNGINSFEVDIDNKVVHVKYDNSQTNLNKIEEAIALAGYDANNKKADPDAYEKLDDCCKKPEDRTGK
jgi:copper chaperone CopZ